MRFQVLGAIAIAVSTLACSASAQDSLRWGMSVTEVQAAVPDIRPVRNGETVSGKQVRGRGRQQLGELDLEALYYFDDAGLAAIQLEGPPRDCRQVIGALVTAHGNPLRVSDQAILRLIIWHDEASDRRVRMVVSTGLCNVHYERLTDYRAHDLAEAGRS